MIKSILPQHYQQISKGKNMIGSAEVTGPIPVSSLKKKSLNFKDFFVCGGFRKIGVEEENHTFFISLNGNLFIK